MVLGCGIDICDNRRFLEMKEGVLKRIFTSSELEEGGKLPQQQRCEFFASRFASKEAFSKALGSGFSNLSPLDLEVCRDEKGCPFFSFSENAALKVEGLSVFLSLSHEKEYSVAMVVIDGQK